jgi:hypothetical protein
MSALWRVSLMSLFNRLLLDRKYVAINALKALASIVSMCDPHEIFLLNITPRYFTLLTNNLKYLGVIINKKLWQSNSMREVDLGTIKCAILLAVTSILLRAVRFK